MKVSDTWMVLIEADLEFNFGIFVMYILSVLISGI